MTHRSRGQSLVLFAFSVLLVTLMVMMTLGFGMRAKEKIELQNMADAAAYSNAVQTARTLNTVALLNRSEVAHQVAMAGTMSLISWSTMYIATLNTMKKDLAVFQGITCVAGLVYTPCIQTCTRAGVVQSRLNAMTTQLMNNVYQDGGPDEAAGAQTKTQQGVSTTVHQLQRATYLDPNPNSLTDWLTKQKLAKEVVTRAQQGSKWPDEIVVPDAADTVSLRETGTGDALFGNPSPLGGGAPAFALSPRGETRELGVKAAMGSRGYSFVAGRAAGPIISTKIWADIPMTAPEAILLTSSGSGRWVATKNRHTKAGIGPLGNSADDEGTLLGFVGNPLCPAPLIGQVESWVYGSDCSQTHEDTHEWTGGADPGNAENGCGHRHTQGTCTNCPGVWTMFIDLNPEQVTDRADHLYGQPKNYASMYRDLNQRCADAWNPGDCGQVDPWNMFFKFRFTPTGADTDMTGMSTFSGVDLSKQTALSAGLAYYHRRGHWREPPNFFNPFWRATLVSPAIDAQGDPTRGGTDMSGTMNDIGNADAADLIDRLGAVGYKGW